MTVPSTQAAVRGDWAPHERLLRLVANVRPGEGRCIALFFSYAFLLLVCYYVLKTVREPLLLEGGSAELKSYAYATVALVLLVLIPLYGFLLRRVDKSRIASWTTVFFVGNLVAFYAACTAGIDIGFAYYVWVGVFGVLVVAQFWAHAADAFAVDSGQRLFPVIMAGATLGGLAGPLIARALYDADDPEWLLLVAAALLAATMPLSGSTRGSVPPASRGTAACSEHRFAHPLGGFALVLRDPYLALAATLVVLLNCVNTIGEYILTELVIRHVDELVALDPSLDRGTLIAQFYAGFLFAVNALTVVAQLFLVARVFRWVGMQGALLVLPVVALLGYVLVAFVPIFTILRVIKVVENAADYSVNNTARHALYLPLPVEEKYEGKIATDTFFWRFGDLLQGAIVFVALTWLGFEIRHFAALNLLLVAVWLAVAVQLAKRYSALTGVKAPRLPAFPAVGRLWPGVAAAVRTVPVRGAAVWVALFAGVAAVSASAPADARLPGDFSAVRMFAGAERVCQAFSARKHDSPLEHQLSLLRGPAMTDERFAAQLRHAARVAIACALSVSAPVFGQAERDASSAALAEGTAVERSQRADEPASYFFHAGRGQTLLIEVEQRGLDFIVSVESPAGDVRRFNSPLLRDETEVVLLEDTYAGRYRLTVASEEQTNALGTHSISLAPVGADADERYLSALRLMSEGARANAEARGRDALEHYEAAAVVWRELDETRRQAQAQYSQAMVLYWSLYDWNDAADRARTAAALYEQLGARTLYANAMLTVGYSLTEAAQGTGVEGQRIVTDALAALRKSFVVHEELGNDYELALVENFTGLAYFNRGDAATQDYRRAEHHYRRAADLFARLGEWRQELLARHNLALISIDEGYAAAAASALEAIVAEFPPGKDPYFRANVLGNLGVAYRDSGNFDAALIALSEAVNLHASLRQFNFEAYALRALGTTYQALGELDRADEYLRQALEKSADDGRVRSAVLAGLGTVAYQRADYAQALDWHRRAVDSTTSAVDRAYRQAFVVRDLVALQRFDDAAAASNSVLANADTPAITKADLSLELGHAYLGLEQPDSADDRFVAALAVYDAGGIATKQAEALRGRALAARARGDVDEAIELGERSLQRIETLRAGVAVPELRAFYAAAHSEYYESQIESLVAAHRLSAGQDARYLADSLSVSERARARVIVDLLGEASIRIDRNRSEPAARREKELYDELRALLVQRDRLLEKSNAEVGELEPLVRRMAAIENELSVSATEARRGGGVRASAAAIPLSAAQIQEQLDERTVLLQYALGSPRSFAWVVARDSLQLVELGDRAAIESAARRVYEDLRTYRPDGSSDVQATLLGELSSLVLAPVAPLIGAGTQRLVVAADGALGYIPFGVLPLARDGDGAPVLEAFEVKNVPSMSAAAAQRGRNGAAPPKTLAVFADPVFAAGDPRLVSPAHSGVVSPNLVSRGALQLERLPATGAEANAIAALVAPDSRLVVTGFDASRERVMDAPLGDYRIVHFATHGLVDSRYPGLSALAFSQFDMAGQPRDGLLRLQDIYALELNADFVVLSGCETALGREIRGEGLIGLANGFLYAGARNLVVSLWQVPDRATAELMTRFYGYVLRDALPPAEALRRAQRSIAAERRWSDPYFWGAFVVLGNS